MLKDVKKIFCDYKKGEKYAKYLFMLIICSISYFVILTLGITIFKYNQNVLLVITFITIVIFNSLKIKFVTEKKKFDNNEIPDK